MSNAVFSCFNVLTYVRRVTTFLSPLFDYGLIGWTRARYEKKGWQKRLCRFLSLRQDWIYFPFRISWDTVKYEMFKGTLMIANLRKCSFRDSAIDLQCYYGGIEHKTKQTLSNSFWIQLIVGYTIVKPRFILLNSIFVLPLYLLVFWLLWFAFFNVNVTYFSLKTKLTVKLI